MNDKTKRILTNIQISLNLLNHIFVFTVGFYMTWILYKVRGSLVGWHAWCCSIGYQLLMSEAILAFYQRNVWSQKYSRTTKRYLHWIIQIFASGLVIIGIITEFINREYYRKEPHFPSTHSILGLIALILTIISCVTGVSALWSVELRQYCKPIYLKFFHILIGVAAFVVGCTALYYGYERGFTLGIIKHNSKDVIQWLLQVIVICTIVLSLIGAVRTLFGQTRTILSI